MIMASGSSSKSRGKSRKKKAGASSATTTTTATDVGVCSVAVDGGAGMTGDARIRCGVCGRLFRAGEPAVRCGGGVCATADVLYHVGCFGQHVLEAHAPRGVSVVIEGVDRDAGRVTWRERGSASRAPDSVVRRVMEATSAVGGGGAASDRVRERVLEATGGGAPAPESVQAPLRSSGASSSLNTPVPSSPADAVASVADARPPSPAATANTATTTDGGRAERAKRVKRRARGLR